LQICKNLGFYLQKRAANVKRMDLIHRIGIRRSGPKRGGLTGRGGFDQGVDVLWAVRWRSNGAGAARAWAAVRHGRR
jgi:hypothetical protein